MPVTKLGKALSVIQYRRFRNTDPPALVALWNDVFLGRGAVQLRSATPLEFFIFAKPYFDPEGLILAIADGVLVGFVHAGFVANADQSALSTETGVTCALGVRPNERGKGIGTELLRQAEEYLVRRGARTLLAGSRAPCNPFYFGLLGGSDSPGVLLSDQTAKPFFLHCGYQLDGTTLVLQRTLPSQTLIFPDARFAALRRNCELRIGVRTGADSWWRECILGPIDLMDFHLEDRTTNQIIATAGVWEMQGFSQRWGAAVIGITSVTVRADLRRKGMARFLVASLLKHAQEQYFTLAEAQVPAEDSATLALFRGLGFEQTDVGHSYRKVP